VRINHEGLSIVVHPSSISCAFFLHLLHVPFASSPSDYICELVVAMMLLLEIINRIGIEDQQYIKKFFMLSLYCTGGL
jgi:hypothetical protein